ncbi:hypothetical protein B0I35DRAFT_417555 [Stachybotrys elegans]|uniref:Zn(2)-C6 fungal-type domain-containing protein n=1 Tax=Stachybotrys elegans TaxID=80388 RepID=A0A8K0T445_9HYPO|nr:hypothetical protein B0I35DRAFT_417555 [Stachybotrys elegans]
MSTAARKSLHACAVCARVKAKCTFETTTSVRCERCHRLDKECSSRAPAPPRPRKVNRRSRVADMEERLEALTWQLAGSQSSSSASSAAAGASSGSSGMELAVPSSTVPTAPTTCPLSAPGPVSRKRAAWGMGEFAVPPIAALDLGGSEWKATAARPPEPLWTLESLWPRPEEGAELLVQYHETSGPLFPFVVVPRDLGEAELRCRKPMLWKALMFVETFFDGARHVKLGRELLEEIVRMAIVSGEKDLGMLQAVQLLIVWFHYGLNNTQVTNLLFLARGMCISLDLEGDAGAIQGRCPNEQDLDYLRAYAGMYYINTLIFATNKRTDVLVDTSYLDTCCQVLEDAKQAPSDEYLLQLVKVQRIAQSVAAAFAPSSSALQLPISQSVRFFRDQIAELRRAIPAHLRDKEILIGNICVVEVLVSEIALVDDMCGMDNMSPPERLELLSHCLGSLIAFFTNRCVTRDIQRPRFLCLSSAEVAYSVLTGLKLLFARVPGWDSEAAARQLRLDRHVGYIAEDTQLVVLQRRNGLFSRIASGVDEPLNNIIRLAVRVRELLRIEAEERRMLETQRLFDDLTGPCWHDVAYNQAFDMSSWPEVDVL